MKKTDFTKALTSYFSTYLPETCGVSPNTCNSYRDAFKLLLLYFQEEKGVPANSIELRMLNRNLASDLTFSISASIFALLLTAIVSSF